MTPLETVGTLNNAAQISLGNMCKRNGQLLMLSIPDIVPPTLAVLSSTSCRPSLALVILAKCWGSVTSCTVTFAAHLGGISQAPGSPIIRVDREYHGIANTAPSARQVRRDWPNIKSCLIAFRLLMVGNSHRHKSGPDRL